MSAHISRILLSVQSTGRSRASARVFKTSGGANSRVHWEPAADFPPVSFLQKSNSLIFSRLQPLLRTAKTWLFTFNNLRPLLHATKCQPSHFQVFAASFAKTGVFFQSAPSGSANPPQETNPHLVASLVP